MAGIFLRSSLVHYSSVAVSLPPSVLPSLLPSRHENKDCRHLYRLQKGVLYDMIFSANAVCDYAVTLYSFSETLRTL